MANYTPNYRLHQWEPEDKFLRTDFNEDFSTIDAALGKTERSARASAYNVYNLMLQSDYEGKFTGYKKALLFDGFTDGEGIASATPGVYHNEQKYCWEMSAETACGQETGNMSYITVPAKGSEDHQITFPFGGVLTSISLRQSGGEGRLTLLDGKSVLVNECVPGVSQYPEHTTYYMQVTVRPGHAYTLRFHNHGAGGTRIYTTDDRLWGWKGVFAPQMEPRATLVSRSWPLTVDTGSKIIMWSRWSGKGLSCGLSLDEGERIALVPVRDQESVDIQTGQAVIEREFQLPVLETPCTRLTLSFTLEREEGAGAALYDYGLIMS